MYNLWYSEDSSNGINLTFRDGSFTTAPWGKAVSLSFPPQESLQGKALWSVLGQVPLFILFISREKLSFPNTEYKENYDMFFNK